MEGDKELKTSLKIGVVGFSRNQFDQEEATNKLHDMIKQIIENYPDREFEIVSGLTNMGVPRLAYLLADQLGIYTTGFSAKQAFSVYAGIYPVKQQIIVGDKFGDESEEFVRYIEVLVRVGGGAQSRHEVELFKAKVANQDLSQCLYEVEVEWYGK